LHEAKSIIKIQQCQFWSNIEFRHFNSVIYKEENVYGDRELRLHEDNAQNQLLESERVKEKIRDFESDMWNY
jgi:hypothetical protein